MNASHFAAFLQHALEENPLATQLVPAERREAALRAWLEVERTRFTSYSFVENFSAACPVDGVLPDAYRPRVLPGAPTVLAGIRFKGGDVDCPFVELIAQDQPLTDALSWEQALARVFAEFAAFRPLHVRLRLPGSSAPPVREERRRVDQVLYAERVETLRARAFEGPAVATAPATDTSWYERFGQAYARWAAEAGDLGGEVTPANRDDLMACLKDGALVCATHEGAWAGVAAAIREDERLLPGFCVMEEFLTAPLRGRGLAASLQRALIDALPAKPGDVVWGTIHGTNLPSQRTAARCGRVPVETWWFVDPAQ